MEHINRKPKTLNRNQKNAILVTLLTLLMMAASCIAGYAGYNIFNETQEYRQSDEAYDFVLGEASSDETEYTIDFDTLAKINPDITGWIRMEGTPINYPVVWSAEKGDYYLKHLFTGEYNNAGCVYIDPHNKSDMSDKNTVIYGHNMRNGTMFAMLANYKNPEFYKADRKVYYLTSDGRAFMLEPFAGYVTVGSDAYVQVSFADDEDFMDYVNAKIERSTFKSEIQITPDDQIVTLSTCSYHANDGRFALFCKSTEIDVEQALVM
ncbi:MAG: class B sortase [Solobacterium sp.]|nr:class B sortase [Solobacterium sp.]